jgi:hypothetical protein
MAKYISHDERAFGPIIYVSKQVRTITEFISDKEEDCNELCELLIINFIEGF